MLNKIIVDFNLVYNKVKLDLKNFIYVFTIFFLILSISSYRFFYLIKKTTKYSANLINWKILYFQSLLMNFFLIGSGHLLRAIRFKKDNITLVEFAGVHFINLLLVIIFNLFFFLLLFYFLSYKKIILIYFIIFFIISLILLNKKTYNFLSKILEYKFKSIKKKYKDIFINFLLYSNYFFSSKKNISFFLFFTLAIFLLEGFSFYLILSNILLDKDFYNFFLFFVLVFYLNKIPYLLNFIGFNEIIVGIFAQSLGLHFIQGSLIQLTYRLFLYMTSIFSFALYYLINIKNIIFKIKR
jgi:hypothetical protein